MNKLIISLTLAAFSLSSAAVRVVTDNSMAASDDNEHMVYTDRGSFGPYIESGAISMGNVNYDYTVHNFDHKIKLNTTKIYGATGTLPIKEWFDIFLMVGYQHIGVSHEPIDAKGAYDDLAEIQDFYDGFDDAPLDSNDLKGHHNVHTALFQFGVDFALPIYSSYKYQLMIKPYIFAGVLVGKTIFSDNTKFLSPVLYGYAYGAGVRAAFRGAFLSAGLRTSHEYFHTYFERRVDHEPKEGDQFMLDFDSYFRPFISLGITLF